MKLLKVLFCLAAPFALVAPAAAQTKIVHDAEYYILEAQHGKKWKACLSASVRLNRGHLRMFGIGGCLE